MLIRRSFVISLIFLLPMILIGGMIAFANTPANTPQGTGPIMSGSRYNSAKPAPPGANAITPRTKGKLVTQDVQQYFQRYPAFPGGPTVSGKPPTITIRFMTAHQASVLMHGEYVGLPDGAPVCYVVMHGPFILTNASAPPGTNVGTPPIIQEGVEVFDAHTGNILVIGTPG